MRAQYALQWLFQRRASLEHLTAMPLSGARFSSYYHHWPSASRGCVFSQALSDSCTIDTFEPTLFGWNRCTLLV